MYVMNLQLVRLRTTLQRSNGASCLCSAELCCKDMIAVLLLAVFLIAIRLQHDCTNPQFNSTCVTNVFEQSSRIVHAGGKSSCSAFDSLRGRS